MQEAFLHFVWKNKLFKNYVQVADTGDQIEIIDIGMHNQDAGPDFTNAKIKINHIVWAGNVEIHTEAGSWIKHKHHADQAYDNVILHVVKKKGPPALNSKGLQIPTISIEYQQALEDKCLELANSHDHIPCHSSDPAVDAFKYRHWIESLAIERLEHKFKSIEAIFNAKKKDWRETCYIVLARAFGFKTNALPFEMMAARTPLKMLLKHANDPFQTEALLFGQSGFLSQDICDPYFVKLQKEYTHLKNLYSLKNISLHLWKFMRLRPTNFPSVRLAQFNFAIPIIKHMPSLISSIKGIEDLRSEFNVKPAPYWETHYNFGKTANAKEKRLGESSIYSLAINAIIPLKFFYGKIYGKQHIVDESIDFLQNLDAEKNRTTQEWAKVFSAEDALQSQGIIQLTNQYCLKKKCLNCPIGNQLIRSAEP